MSVFDGLRPDYPVPLAACVYCDDLLEFRGGFRDGDGPAWRHANGQVYAGHCRCMRVSHASATDCPTWRDDHAALPDRSRVPGA